MHLAPEHSVELSKRLEVGLTKSCELNPRSPNLVVPPQCHRVSLNHFQKPMQYGLFQVGPSGVSVRIGPAEIVLHSKRIAEIARCRSHVLKSLLSQRPYRRPFNLPLLVERLRYPVVLSFRSVGFFPLSVLTGAKLHTRIGMDGLVVQSPITSPNP